MRNDLFRFLFPIAILCLASAALQAQSYAKFFPAKGERNSTAKIWHIAADHYYLFRTYPIDENVHEEKYLQIIEYDYCGIVNVQEIYFDQLWSIDLSGEIFESQDSLRIPVRANPTPNGPHTEIGLISLDIKTLAGKYQYLRALNVIHNTSLKPYLEEGYLVQGFASYTDRPVSRVVFRLNANFEIVDYYQHEGVTTASGDLQIRDNAVYSFAGNQMMKLGTDLAPQWIKYIHWYHYFLKSIAVEDGFILAIVKRYGDRNLTLVKIDLAGEVIWQSQNLLFDSENSRIVNIVEKSDGEILVFKQKRNTDYLSEGIVLTNIDASDGSILQQWRADEEYGKLNYRDFILKGNGGSLVADDDEDNVYVIKFDLDTLSNCPLTEVEEFTPLVEVIIRDTMNFPNVSAPFETGSFVFSPTNSRAMSSQLCQDELPVFDLLPEQQTLCGDQFLLADLSEIPFKVSWSDGSEEIVREINSPGTYAYSYEVCDELYGEQVIVESDSCPCDWYLPNVFSPDSWTVNDYYFIQNSCKEITFFYIEIFNRWGGLMYASKDPTFRWDGRWKGRALQSGVYTYLLQYEDAKHPGQRQRLHGTIAMLR